MIVAICRLQAIRKDDRNFMFKGQKAVYNKQITTTTGLFTSEQYVKNRVSSPLSAWKKDYVDAGKPSQQPTTVRMHGTSCAYEAAEPVHTSGVCFAPWHRLHADGSILRALGGPSYNMMHSLRAD